MLWNDSKISIDVTIGWDLWSGNTLQDAGYVFSHLKTHRLSTLFHQKTQKAQKKTKKGQKNNRKKNCFLYLYSS